MPFRTFGCRPTGGPTQEPAFTGTLKTAVVWFDRLPTGTTAGDVVVSTAAPRPPLWQQSRADGRAPGGARWARAGVRGFPSSPDALGGA